MLLMLEMALIIATLTLKIVFSILPLTCATLLEEFTNDEGEIDVDNPARSQYCTDIIITAVTLAQQIINQS